MAEPQQRQSVAGKVWVKAIFKKKAYPTGFDEKVLKDEMEDLEVHQFVTAPANANARLGTTINLGDFNSLKVEVGAAVPCYFEELPEATDWVVGFVEKRIRKERDEILAQLSGDKGI